MRYAVPYLNFPGHTEEVFRHYHSVFGGELSDIVRFRDIGVPDEAKADRVGHVTLTLGDGVMLMGSDTMDDGSFEEGSSVHIMIEPESAEEADRIFAALADGGRVRMELQNTGWAEKHGSCTDRYGTHWMINYTGDVRFG